MNPSSDLSESGRTISILNLEIWNRIWNLEIWNKIWNEIPSKSEKKQRIISFEKIPWTRKLMRSLRNNFSSVNQSAESSRCNHNPSSRVFDWKKDRRVAPLEHGVCYPWTPSQISTSSSTSQNSTWSAYASSHLHIVHASSLRSLKQASYGMWLLAVPSLPVCWISVG